MSRVIRKPIPYVPNKIERRIEEITESVGIDNIMLVFADNEYIDGEQGMPWYVMSGFREDGDYEQYERIGDLIYDLKQMKKKNPSVRFYTANADDVRFDTHGEVPLEGLGEGDDRFDDHLYEEDQRRKWKWRCEILDEDELKELKEHGIEVEVIQ
ncbi:MAG: hypothetical protein ACE5J7_04455 [Candidatus Aenigmatarchaeota archaeon]